MNRIDLLGNLPPPIIQVSKDGVNWVTIDNQPNQKKESVMDTQINNERHYLNTRITNLEWNKIEEAAKHFNIHYHPSPKNGKELREWVKAGRIAVREGLKDTDSFEDDGNSWDMPHDYLIFTDPERVRDYDGYEKAKETIKKDVRETKDIINILPSLDGLKALKEFEEKTYH